MRALRGVLADEGDQEPAELGTMQRRNPLDASRSASRTISRCASVEALESTISWRVGSSLGRSLGNGEVVDEQAQVGEGLLGAVLEVEHAVAVVAVGGA